MTRVRNHAPRALCGQLLLLLSLSPGLLLAQPADGCTEAVSAQLRVDQGHPWRPPFGVERVGAPPVAHVTLSASKAPAREYQIAAFKSDRELERRELSFRKNPTVLPLKPEERAEQPHFASAALKSWPDEVVLYARCASNGSSKEIARTAVTWREIEAQAAARPDRQINPIDLGTILVPNDWLLLAGGQTAVVDVALLSRVQQLPNARLRVWFNGGRPVDVGARLARNKRFVTQLKLPLMASGDRTTLHVSLLDGARELWKKDIPTMVVSQAPRMPPFGAIETKLRYDAPIAMSDPNTGNSLPAIDYDTAWDQRLKDVVVSLPNGSRLVFWRGASYVPMWAGPYNTGVSYQWTENLSHPVSHPDGTQDLREPLFDSELRYGRVQIVESTASRVHVRWTYQLTDVHYSVLGDYTTEEFYFYPDGFGTRVMTLISRPEDRYQLTEFIILTPQSAFPLDVLPSHMADVLYLQGERKPIIFPFQQDQKLPKELRGFVTEQRQQPMIVRVFQHKKDPAGAIYFDPRERTTPSAYPYFYDQGELVTPTYWGSHWPLGRGRWTGWTINDWIHNNPAHNSLLGIGYDPPKPLMISEGAIPDATGTVREMVVRRWSALIAKTDAADNVLIDWAHSYTRPPSLEVSGASLGFPSYSAERRALRLVAQAPAIDITLKPAVRTVNPVFEIEQAPKQLNSVTVDGKALTANDYAWDGSTLWTKAVVDERGATISLRFGAMP